MPVNQADEATALRKENERLESVRRCRKLVDECHSKLAATSGDIGHYARQIIGPKTNTSEPRFAIRRIAENAKMPDGFVDKRPGKIRVSILVSHLTHC